MRRNSTQHRDVMTPQDAVKLLTDAGVNAAVVWREGPLASANKEMNRIKAERNREIGALKKRYQQAVATGRTTRAQRLAAEIAERELEFAELAQGLAEAYRGAQR